MPKVVFIALDGTQHVVDAHPGESVMAAAVRSGVPGIVGECGGNCSCATCHIYIDREFAVDVGGPGEMEEDVLELGAAAERRESSRLSCQITMIESLDGLIVHIPEEQ
ncbi:2Fe-2S iron-sulfur cluster-binding protein [Mycolicibacterium gadium]|uniref:(2Fe-2S)-binding protein n=1 Tax=Mycolicibacterium gadium TaxID=1794 RepID=A0ABT6GU74_MYCGU|nr:2Fe-2S iron-sulfur cluster-binding protein [Mycolicibacterium gadium]MDG5484634.1 (2Fe-2S)-binding protein [Mycolicibacterium gadium]